MAPTSNTTGLVHGEENPFSAISVVNSLGLLLVCAVLVAGEGLVLDSRWDIEIAPALSTRTTIDFGMVIVNTVVFNTDQ